MVPMRAHSSSLTSPAEPCSLQEFASATFFGLFLVGLLAGCGSGESSSGGGGGTPSPSSVTQVVGSAGGTVSLSDGSSVTIDSGVLKDGTQVTVSSSSQPSQPVPEGAQVLSSTVTLKVPAEGFMASVEEAQFITVDLPILQASTASLLSQVLTPSEAFAQAIDTFDYSLVVVRPGSSTARTTPMYLPPGPITIILGKQVNRVRVAAGQIKGAVIDSLGELGFTIYNIRGCYPSSTELYQYDTNANVWRPTTNPVVPAGVMPLVLVHGIQDLEFCNILGFGPPYKSTWKDALRPILDDPDLKNKFQLFSVNYNAVEPRISELGKQLAGVLNTAFGQKPVVVLAHSMGGLVTRAAMTSTPPDDLFTLANVAGLITLGTPHRGTPLASREGFEKAKTIRQFLWPVLLENGSRPLRDMAFIDLSFHDLDGNPGNPFLETLRKCERGELPTCRSTRPYDRLVAIAGRVSSPWDSLFCVRELLGASIDGDNDIIVPVNSARFDGEAVGGPLGPFPGVAHTSPLGGFKKFCIPGGSPITTPPPPDSILNLQPTSQVFSVVKSALLGFHQAPPPPPPPTYQGIWSATGSMATGRYGHTATVLSTGKVLVVGGDDTSPLASAELYDPAAGAWSMAGSLATRRFYHTATLLQTGKVLVVGGTVGFSVFASAELYDPAANGGTGAWTTTGSLVTGRWQYTATLLLNGKVLVVGGNGSLGGSTGALASAELYDPAANSGVGAWTLTGSLSVGRIGHTATLLPTGKVLVVGGASGLASAELYDPATGAWTPIGSRLSIGHVGHTATLLPNGKVLVVGNYDSTVGFLGSAELYDPLANGGVGTWTQTGSVVAARSLHTATLLPNGKVLVVGGQGDATGNIQDSAGLYDPAANGGAGAWTPTGSLPRALFLHTATLLPTGKVLVAGGSGGGTGGLASAELFQ